MGYHVNLIRSSTNSVFTDKELEEAFKSLAGYAFRISGNLVSVLNEISGNKFSVSYYDGRVWAVNPTQETLEFLVRLADSLNARVRGDNLETYNADGTSFYHYEDSKIIKEVDGVEKHSKFKVYVRKYLLNFILFTLLLLIVYLIDP
ncbi:hypothetical protein R50073_37900 [Maricurvus nonylphenolicus]|uniref:hypothetical protein n=1 Tax=Maricurvus nonylphenolicus TaxID=1008307 RepID=UPI0036F31792